MQILLLIAAIVLGLFMIPFGFPGTLVMFAAALCYYLLVPAGGIGLATVVGVGVLMVVAEGLEWILTARFTKKYGGSRRAGWGAIIGGMVGAFLGVPVPIIGSIVGAFVGAFLGAFVFEYTRGTGHGTATRVAWGAFVGRVTAAAIKVAIGFMIAVWMIAAVMF
ncbi:MAG TPA: DUF456 domain-containing protein [Gemmatimonadaceae bacterium]|jgi:uncharacterized protein YqgC (DUF456 family)|nr:DUF456 domain-containing protein [Gemmatimonadaceae bacterium]HWJ15740.1 DUF456 domain-containing protein [Gemmatimonadaceae bacterium]